MSVTNPDPEIRLRPDQLRRQRREAEAARILAQKNRPPKKVKPIVLLSDCKPRKRSKKRKRYCYCYGCLRKYSLKRSQQISKCLDCDGEIREVKSIQARAGVVSRLKIHRGLRKAKRKGCDYETYLQSALWKTIRNRVLERDEHRCRDCGENAQHVHHLSYSKAVMAGLDDSQLLSLCVPCHDARHPDKPSMVRKK